MVVSCGFTLAEIGMQSTALWLGAGINMSPAAFITKHTKQGLTIVFWTYSKSLILVPPALIHRPVNHPRLRHETNIIRPRAVLSIL